MTAAQAAAELAALRRFFLVLTYTPDVLEAWQRLVIAQNVTGKQAHDAHLVAVMQVHAITTILTFNGSDFARFPGIHVLDPAQV
jgi:predicted nucleic acid-binding protein